MVRVFSGDVEMESKVAVLAIAFDVLSKTTLDQSRESI